VDLPGHLGLLQHPLVLAASGFMTLVEFFADKLPWLDSVWDAIHTFIRIPAGAPHVAAMFGDGGAAVKRPAAILGGTVAAGTHFAKSGTRAAINTSPEPFSNWTASLSEDALVPTGLWLAFAHPLAFFVLLALFAVASVLLVRTIWRGLRAILS
jgi:hypothetical protein